MTITIHRGINQIGGCIAEIATSNARILIDLGLNLPDNKGNTNDDLATKEAVAELTRGIDAIFYTHHHGDHIGMFNLVPKGIAQYIGEVAQEVCIAKHTRLGKIKGRETESAEEVATIERMIPMRVNRKVAVGDITITPYFVSHSAYESFMLLIEADGKKVLHSGDFRDHGYLGKGLVKTIKAYIGEVDVLIIEGTMLSRSDARVKSERELQIDIQKIMRQKNNCFVICSSTDLERLASIYAAHHTVRPNAPFICDGFQKEVFDIFSKSAGKKCKGLFNFDKAITYESNQANIWKEGFTMLIRCTAKYDGWVNKLLPTLWKEETTVVFSMWEEYIKPDSQHVKADFLNMIKKFETAEKAHTSGHASKECLAKVCALTNPRLAIIPIHSERSVDFRYLPISDEHKEKVITESKAVRGFEIVIGK